MPNGDRIDAVFECVALEVKLEILVILTVPIHELDNG